MLYRFVAPIRVATVNLALAVFVLQVERGSFSTGSGFLLYGTVLLSYAGLCKYLQLAKVREHMLPDAKSILVYIQLESEF